MVTRVLIPNQVAELREAGLPQVVLTYTKLSRSAFCYEINCYSCEVLVTADRSSLKFFWNIPKLCFEGLCHLPYIY